MAKVIVAWCDPCMNDDQHTPGNPFVISLGVNMKPKEIDLCETHEKEFLNPLRELLGEVGQPVGSEQLTLPTTPSSNSSRAACPECGKELGREGMRGHVIKFHGKTRIEAGEVVRSIFGSVRSASVKIQECPECKAEGKLSPAEYLYDTPQGLGAHRKTAHGVDGTGRTDK